MESLALLSELSSFSFGALSFNSFSTLVFKVLHSFWTVSFPCPDIRLVPNDGFSGVCCSLGNDGVSGWTEKFSLSCSIWVDFFSIKICFTSPFFIWITSLFSDWGVSLGVSTDLPTISSTLLLNKFSLDDPSPLAFNMPSTFNRVLSGLTGS